MAKIKLTDGGKYAHFHCPGCGEMHMVSVKPQHSQGWGFNGSVDAPTFSPSVLVRQGHYASHYEGSECWCNFKERTGEEPAFSCGICHSFVTDGKIQFLSDCTHKLAGQTVPMENMD